MNYLYEVKYLQAAEMVVMEDIPLPEFDRSHRIHQQRALVFEYDRW